MKQEEKQLLLVDLCARLSYGVIVHSSGIPHEQKLIGYIPDIEKYCIKPYLRSISSMTEEERKEYLVECDKDDEDSITTPRYHGIDWLNEHHLDYRGLIPMGLALEAPENMYQI